MVVRANRLTAFGAVVVAAAAMVGCAHKGENLKAMSEMPVMTTAQAAKINLKEEWQIPLGANGRDRVTGVWPEGKTVYVGTAAGTIVSVSSNSGVIQWERQIGGGIEPVRRPAIVPHKNELAIVASGSLVMVNRRSGKVLSRHNLFFPPGTAPLVSANTVLIGSIQARFYGLFLNLPSTYRWAMPSEGDSFISDPVLLSGQRVAFASNHGYVWKKDVVHGTGGWHRRVSSSVRAPLTQDGQRVYVPCTDGELYAFDILSGDLDWEAQLAGGLRRGAMPAGRVVLAVGQFRGLYAVSKRTGAIKWGPIRGIKQVTSHTGRHAYAVTRHNNLALVRLRDGAITARAMTSHGSVFAFRTKHPSVFIATSDGRLAKFSRRSGQ